MIVREYIEQKLQSFGLTEAQFADFEASSSVDLSMEYTNEVQAAVGVGLCSMIEELVLAPKMSNVNEGGFSMSWDYSGLSKYYLWLCRKWGVKPNEDALSAMGTSAIIDRSGMW